MPGLLHSRCVPGRSYRLAPYSSAYAESPLQAPDRPPRVNTNAPSADAVSVLCATAGSEIKPLIPAGPAGSRVNGLRVSLALANCRAAPTTESVHRQPMPSGLPARYAISSARSMATVQCPHECGSTHCSHSPLILTVCLLQPSGHSVDLGLQISPVQKYSMLLHE